MRMYGAARVKLGCLSARSERGTWGVQRFLTFFGSGVKRSFRCELRTGLWRETRPDLAGGAQFRNIV